MILSLVVLQIVRSIGLVSQTEIVYGRDSALPVSDENVSRRRAVYVVLPSGEVPHEISPVHPVHLIVKEERKILEERRLLVLRAGYGLASSSHI